MESLGMERMGQHGSPCGLWHPFPRWPEPTVLRELSAGPVDQALEGGRCPGPLQQLSQLRVGPALPPWSFGGSLALGIGMGVGARCGVAGTGGGSGPGGILVVLRGGGVRGE